MTGTHLPGLEASNPLGFLAALGVQVAFEQEQEPLKLWWSDDVVPHAITDDSFSVEEIATLVKKISLHFLPKTTKEDIKFNEKKDQIRIFLQEITTSDPHSKISFALVAEGEIDKKSNQPRPTALDFTAGNQKFLSIARSILAEVQETQIVDALFGRAGGSKKGKTLGWEVTDDRRYALRATDPGPADKVTKPGLEAMAILGVSCFPVYGSPSGTLTRGCSSSGRRNYFTWLTWDKPAGPGAVASLLASATHAEPSDHELDEFFESWGITRVLRSQIRKPEGYYAQFGPPEVIWNRDIQR